MSADVWIVLGRVGAAEEVKAVIDPATSPEDAVRAADFVAAREPGEERRAVVFTEAEAAHRAVVVEWLRRDGMLGRIRTREVLGA